MVNAVMDRLATATSKTTTLPTICPHCGGRLFQDNEYVRGRLFYFMECINCSRTFDEHGSPLYHSTGKRRARVIW